MRVQADIRKLAAYGLNIDDLRTTLGNANVNTPKGNFDGPSRAYTINANDQLTNADAYKSLVIAYKNGSPVRLSDVAQVIDAAQNNKLAAWMNTVPAVILNIQRQPAANVIQVVDRIEGAAAKTASRTAIGRRRRGTNRPHRHDTSVGQGRGIGTDFCRHPGRSGDLYLSAQRARNDYPKPLGTAVVGGYLCCHVSIRISVTIYR